MEPTVKLTDHAKRRMRGQFHPPLRPEEVAEALRKGMMYPSAGSYYFEHRNVGLILKSRINAECDFHVVTVLNLNKKPFSKANRSPPQRSPFKRVKILF